MNKIPQKIKRLRRAAGLTQQQLAAQLGVTAQTIKNWEAGRRGISPRYHDELARLGGTSTAAPVSANSRPKYADLAPGDWAGASKYGWCELKYDGEYCEFHGYSHGWAITDRKGHAIDSGLDPMPTCHLLMEHIVGTEWARRSGLFGSYVAWGALSSKGVHLSLDRLAEFVRAIAATGLPIRQSSPVPLRKAPGLWLEFVLGGEWEGLIFRTAGGRFARMKRRVTMDYVCTDWGDGSVTGALYNKRGKLIDKVSVPCPEEPLLGQVFEASGLAVTERGSLRNPRFERWRDDKLARECTR